MAIWQWGITTINYHWFMLQLILIWFKRSFSIANKLAAFKTTIWMETQTWLIHFSYVSLKYLFSLTLFRKKQSNMSIRAIVWRVPHQTIPQRRYCGRVITQKGNNGLWKHNSSGKPVNSNIRDKCAKQWTVFWCFNP